MINCGLRPPQILSLDVVSFQERRSLAKVPLAGLSFLLSSLSPRIRDCEPCASHQHQIVFVYGS